MNEFETAFASHFGFDEAFNDRDGEKALRRRKRERRAITKKRNGVKL